jgi:hypothetical protein
MDTDYMLVTVPAPTIAVDHKLLVLVNAEALARSPFFPIIGRFVTYILYVGICLGT